MGKTSSVISYDRFFVLCASLLSQQAVIWLKLAVGTLTDPRGNALFWPVGAAHSLTTPLTAMAEKALVQKLGHPLTFIFQFASRHIAAAGLALEQAGLRPVNVTNSHSKAAATTGLPKHLARNAVLGLKMPFVFL